MSTQAQLPLEPEKEGPDTPQVYVASSLTHLNRAGIRLVRDECDIINNAIVDISRETSDPWQVRVHVPAVWSAPSASDTRGAEEIYRLNSSLVFCDCDALIVHGYEGGSMGAGQEFAWADQLGLPILYLYYKGEPVSRQLAGTPAFLETCGYDGPVELRDAVRDFIRRWRPVIEDGPRRRRSLARRYEPMRIALRMAWNRQLTKHQEISALSRLSERRIDELLERPERLAVAPLDRLVGLATAVGLELGHLLLPAALPELGTTQVRALFAAEPSTVGHRTRPSGWQTSPASSWCEGARGVFRLARSTIGQGSTRICSVNDLAERAASDLLQRLGVSSSPPIDVEAIAAAVGVTRIRRRDQVEDGRLERNGASTVIYVKAGPRLQRRRFTIAHELGHLLLAGDVPDVAAYRAGKRTNEERFL
ncbi:MAG: ImmA/IrrE family metallo-endopeptidase [Actinomycetota bacterium]